jgi:hypothetical protein
MNRLMKYIAGISASLPVWWVDCRVRCMVTLVGRSSWDEVVGLWGCGTDHGNCSPAANVQISLAVLVQMLLSATEFSFHILSP